MEVLEVVLFMHHQQNSEFLMIERGRVFPFHAVLPFFFYQKLMETYSMEWQRH